ncbi:MAG: PDZ domain-containing protein, partial [Myxococcales bacterium]|nr:PDZ domain-containing protein [Myxococcales bacterium]
MPSSSRSIRTLRDRFRYLVTFIALACGLYISIVHSDRGGLTPTANNLFASPELEEDEYDLQGLHILNRALLQVKDNYVEPARVDPERMLVYALSALQDQIPQVVSRFDRPIPDGPTSVELQVGGATQTFDLTDVTSMWEMSFRLREVFRFVQENLDDDDVDLRLVEYAAINGMLNTLDPHSVLLSPEVFADMQANNSGSFGGLGIVISIRDGQLTIISPIEGTPAHRAGLRSADRILKIGEESTINMNIEEAVSRLRGEVGTAVTIEVMREGWNVPHEFSIVRERISIQSVKSHVLGDGIGYVSISNFQANTHDDLVDHLNRLREEMGGEINGLVLDLRDNPGGLLEQAIRVADTFLADGTIVTTVGEGHRLREEKKATEEGTEPFYPIVVLLNSGSASASEIVAGALQNHGRALLVGDRSFGKGSVQVLYEFQDGSALKLTIAQYLTPGDISIQGVGVVPDIAIVPMIATADEVNLFPSERVIREGDLESSLDSDRAADLRTPDHILGYFREPEPEPDPSEIIDPDEFDVDFEIGFAQRMLVAAGETWEVEPMLEAISAERTEATEEQIALVAGRLAELGVDWSAGENPEELNVDLEVTSNLQDYAVEAGSAIEFTVSATNNGDAPIYRLRGLTVAEYGVFDDHEFVFGLIEPGETRSWTVSVDVPEETPTRMERVRFELRSPEITVEPEEILTEVVNVTVEGRERPQFAFYYQIVDDEAGNGDGLLQLDEDVYMDLTVTNVGGGASTELLVYLKNQVESAVLLEHGRETWEEGLASGESRTARFQFMVQHAPTDNTVRLEAAIYDSVFREFTNATLEL